MRADEKPSISKILNAELCAGCGLCESITNSSLQMHISDEGFLRPRQVEEISLQEKEIIDAVCPAIKVSKKSNEKPPYRDLIWGDYYSCLIGTSTNDNIRDKASSGGFITSALSYLLHEKIIDAAIHIGPSLKDPFLNVVKISKTDLELIENANSRYAPAAPLTSVLQEIKTGLKYAFVGKPCDIAALRQLSYINENVKKNIIYYFSFFCAGTPSMKATEELVNNFGLKLENVLTIDYRKDGWPGSFKVFDKKGKEYNTSYNESWGKVLSKHLQMRCKICGDGLGESADITCGDGWSDFDSKGYPTFKNEQGKSIIISKTNLGENLLKELIRAKKIRKISLIDDMRLLDTIQPGQLNKKQFLKARLLAFKLLGRKHTIFDNYLYIKANAGISYYKQMRQTVGTLIRIFNRSF